MCNQSLFFFSSRRRHTRYWRDWSSDVCSSDLAGVVYNSVMSGNACAANNNIQYAAHVGSEASADITTEKPTVWYTAVQNHDISDWSNTVQHNVFSLANSNMPVGNAVGNHTLFHERSEERR